MNILINSAQAIAEKFGKDASHKGTILVSTRQKSNSVEIRIQDDGGGIPANIRDRVFEPFFTTKPVGKGTGQGLALVHNVIVNKHSGRVWIESEPGDGTTMVIQLPLGDESNSQPAAEPVSSSASQ